ncbi:MAG: hypothetical protein ACOZAM_15275, partial [Pseudomonadota bacterium]
MTSSLLKLRPMLAAMAAFAVMMPAAAAQTADDLNTLQQQLDASKSLQQQIAAEREAIVEEQAALSQKLIALAEKIQS